MKLLIDICHPAHVHYFKNLYKELINNHQVYVTCKDEKSVIDLLNAYQIPYMSIGKKAHSILGKIGKQLYFSLRIWWMCFTKNIDIALGCSPSIVHASLLCKCHSILFDDDDQKVQFFTRTFVSPFASCILSPDTLKHEQLKNAIYYSGFQELAYLDPNVFNSYSRSYINIEHLVKKPYSIVRFNAFKAHHDINKTGMNLHQKRQLIQVLQKYGQVYITTENLIDSEFQEFQCKVPPQEMHNLMKEASLFVSDSQTMTTESALLGVPAFRCNSFAGELANINEIEYNWGLVFSYKPHEFDLMLQNIEDLLSRQYAEEWQAKREQMLNQKINVLEFWKWFIEQYPQSVQIMRENPNYQWNFKYHGLYS